MLKRLSDFIADVMGNSAAPDRFAENDHRLAAAALLVHAAAIDGNTARAEQTRLKALLQSQFNLNEKELDDLLVQAKARDAEAVDLYGFTSVLARALDQDGRKRIVAMLWEIVYADGEVHEFEDNLVWRVAELLGVSTRDRMQMKRDTRRARGVE